MIFVVNGLRVALEPSLHCIGAPLCDGPFDVTWRVARVNHPSKAAAEGAILPDGLYGSLVDRDGSIWTRLVTFFNGHLLSNFFVSADGRLVHTEAFQRMMTETCSVCLSDPSCAPYFAIWASLRSMPPRSPKRAASF